MAKTDLQSELVRSDRGRVMAMDSAYHVRETNRHRDVVVNASYCGCFPPVSPPGTNPDDAVDPVGGDSMTEAAALHVTLDYACRLDVTLSDSPAPEMPDDVCRRIQVLPSKADYLENTWQLMQRKAARASRDGAFDQVLAS